VELHGVFLWNHKGVATTQRLNIQEGVAGSSALEDPTLVPLSSLGNFERRNLSLDDSTKDASRHDRDGTGPEDDESPESSHNANIYLQITLHYLP